MPLKAGKKKKKRGGNTTTTTTTNKDFDRDDGDEKKKTTTTSEFPLSQRRLLCGGDGNKTTTKEDFVAFCAMKMNASNDGDDEKKDDERGQQGGGGQNATTEVVVSREDISDALHSMSRAYRVDRLGATLALDLAMGKQTEARKVFEALKATKEEKNEETPPPDDDDDDDVNGSDEEETTMFERVFGDACKKVPKSNDVRFRAPLEALRKALDVVDTLEEKKRKRRNEDGGERANNGTGGGGGGGKSCTSGEYDSDDDSDDDETEYSTEDFQSSEASSLLSFGERARGTQKNSATTVDTSTKHHQTSSSTSLFRDIVFAAYHIFALNDAKKQAFDKWISDDVNRLYAKDLLLSEKEIKDDEKKPCAATRAEFLRVACASRASSAEKVALETLETRFPRWQIQIQRAKRRRDVSSRIANERWVRLLQTHASEIRQKVEESPEDADFALAWKKMREFTRKFDVTEAQQNAYAATDPIAQKESARVADACRAMLLDGLNAACGVSISNLSIVEDDSQYYNSDVFKKQRLLIAKECGRPLRSLDARCAQARKQIGILTSRAFAAAPIVSTAAIASMFQTLSFQYELHKKQLLQTELLEEESIEREEQTQRERLKKQAKLERSQELARRKLEKEKERKGRKKNSPCVKRKTNVYNN